MAVEIYYYDLGLHTGDEIKMFLADSADLGIPRHVFGFDPAPRYVAYCRKRYAAYPEVQIIQAAVGRTVGRVQLFLEPSGLGSSIYADKRNVSKRSIEVDAIRLSDFIVSRGLMDDPRHIHVIRANIEGAEWDVALDLDEHGLWPEFDIVCGTKHGWWADMNKCSSLRSKIPELQAMFARHGIVPVFYQHRRRDKGKPPASIRGQLTALVAARQGRP